MKKLIKDWDQKPDKFDPIPNFGNKDLNIIIYIDENKYRQENKYQLFSYDGEILLKTDSWKDIKSYVEDLEAGKN